MTVAVIIFLGMVMATKIITGEERLSYCDHEIVIMVVAALFLWLTHQPILFYLDITILGIGTFLFCGRIGCLMVGCCHGRPYHWGVCYRPEHAAVGFPPYYVGVRLFPIQARRRYGRRSGRNKQGSLSVALGVHQHHQAGCDYPGCGSFTVGTHYFAAAHRITKMTHQSEPIGC